MPCSRTNRKKFETETNNFIYCSNPKTWCDFCELDKSAPRQKRTQVKSTKAHLMLKIIIRQWIILINNLQIIQPYIQLTLATVRQMQFSDFFDS